MAIRARINILICIVLSVILTAACTGKEYTYRVEYFSVTGIIYDKTAGFDEITGAVKLPVQGITVRMDAYASDDIGMESPVFTRKCYSSSEGLYQFSLKSDDNLFDMFFVFSLSDETTYREICYESEERVLYLSPASPFFNSTMKSYDVTGNDFYLFPKDN